MDRFPGAAGLLGLGGSPFVRDQIGTSGGTSGGSSTVAAFTSGTIDGTTIGGSTPAAGTFTTVNATGTYQIGGNVVLQVQGTTNGSTMVGIGAGGSPAAGLQGVTAVGWGSLASITSAAISICENTAVGYLSLNRLVPSASGPPGGGYYNTAVGCGAQWNEVTSNGNVSVGGDSMRDTVGMSYTAALGFRSAQNGAAIGTVAAGFAAVQGNSSAVTITGAPSTNDIVNLTFTGTFSGSPKTVSYPVLSSDTTLAILTTSLITAINANGFLGNGSVGNAYGTSNCLLFNWPGTSGTGWAVTITSSITGSGAGSEIVTVTSTGNVGNYNIGIGYQALVAHQLSIAVSNIGIGAQTLGQIQTGGYNVAMSYQAGALLSTGTNNIMIGQQAGAAAVSSTNMVAIGGFAFSANTVGNPGVAIGYFAGKNTTAAQVLIGYLCGQNLTTSGSNVAVGNSALTGAASSTAQNNTAIGTNSLTVVSSGVGNVAVGFNSGEALNTGQYNVFIGTNCANSGTTSGTGNIFIQSGSTAYTPSNPSYTLYIGCPLTGATGTITATGMNSTTPLVTMPGGSLTLGVSTVTGGSLILMGSTSGSVTVKPPAVAGSATVVLAPGASAQAVVAAPTAPASTTTYFMQGLAGSITPASSGKLHITMSGTVVDPSGTAAGNGILYQLSYGTGSAPSNAGALAGTQVGAVQSYTSPNTVIAADTNVPFALTVVVTGLVVGTAYWLDLAAKSIATASSMGLANISISVMEFL